MKFEDTNKKNQRLCCRTAHFFHWRRNVSEPQGLHYESRRTPGFGKEARAAANPKDADGLAEKIAANVNVILPKGHPVGSKDAPISIYEYSSFGCYHCSDFHLEIPAQTSKRLY